MPRRPGMAESGPSAQPCITVHNRVPQVSRIPAFDQKPIFLNLAGDEPIRVRSRRGAQ